MHFTVGESGGWPLFHMDVPSLQLNELPLPLDPMFSVVDDGTCALHHRLFAACGRVCPFIARWLATTEILPVKPRHKIATCREEIMNIYCIDTALCGDVKC